MFGVGGFELFLILLFGFLIFGPDKLPAIAETIGKAIAKFRSAQKKMDFKLDKNAFLSNDPEHPIKNPIEVLDNAAKSIDAMRNGSGATAKTGATASVGKNAEEGATKKPTKPGGAIENYPTFAERKAAYERAHGKDVAQGATQGVQSTQVQTQGTQAQAAQPDAQPQPQPQPTASAQAKEAE